MRFARVILAAALVVAVFDGAVPVQAGEEAKPAPAEAGERTVASAVPADALFFVAAAGREKWKQAFKDSNPGAVWREEEVNKFLAPFVEKAGAFLAGKKQQAEKNTQGLIKFDEIEKALVGEMGLAILGVKPRAGGADEKPIILLVAEVGENAQAFETGMDDFVKRVQQLAPQADLRARAYRGIDLRTFAVGEGAFVYARDKGYFLFALDAASVEKAIDCLEGAAPALAGRPTFKKSDNGLLAAEMNVAEFLKKERVKNPDDKNWKYWDLTGFAGARSLSYRLEFEKPLFHERLALDMDKAEGLFALLKETKPVDARKLAADAPADALAFMGGRLPADKVLDIFFKAAEADKPNAGNNRRKQILALKAQGFDLEALLTKSLTGEVAVWAAMPAAGGLFPEVVISARTTDNSPVEQMIQFIAAAQQAKLKAAQQPGAAKPDEPAPANFKLEPTDYKGGKLFVFPAQPGNPVVLSALVLPDRVIFASDPVAAKRAATPPDAGGLSEKAEFKEKLAKLPPNAVGVQYLDVPRIFSLVYGTGAKLLPPRAGERLKERFGLDLAQRPPAELVSKHLVPEVGCFYADEKGLRLEARSNAPRAALLATFAAIIARGKAEAVEQPLPGRPAEPPAKPRAKQPPDVEIF